MLTGMVNNMDFKKVEKKILEVLNNLEGVNISNKLKAEAISFEVEKLLTPVFVTTKETSNENRTH